MRIFLFFRIKTIYCDPSSEPSHRDGSDEGSQHMFFMQNQQKLSLIIIKYSLLSRALREALLTPTCVYSWSTLYSDC